MSPEHELLVLCARTDSDAETTGRVQDLLRRDLDWQYLLRTAFQHGVLPLLYRLLKDKSPSAVPSVSRNQLSKLFLGNAARNHLLTMELCRILDLFDAHAIPSLPLRGPALAASLYGDVVFRQFGDLDLLLQEHHVIRARKLLINAGYQPQFHLRSAQEEAFLRYSYVHQLLRRDINSSVELHWAMAPRHFPFPLDLEELWQNLTESSLGGRTVLVLPPAETLLTLCVHGSKHLWQRLIWIADIARFITAHRSLDWDRVLGRASALGCRRMLLLAVSLAGDILGAALPEELHSRAQADPTIRPLTTRVRQRLFAANEARPGTLPKLLFHLQARERLRDRLRHGLSFALKPTYGDWSVLPLPPHLFFTYYLLRPIRVAAKYGLAALID